MDILHNIKVMWGENPNEVATKNYQPSTPISAVIHEFKNKFPKIQSTDQLSAVLVNSDGVRRALSSDNTLGLLIFFLLLIQIRWRIVG